MVPSEHFGAYLRRLRESQGLTLRQAAGAAQVSSSYLSQIEGGKRGKRKRGEHFAPHPQILRRIAEVYHVPAQELFERAGFFEGQEQHRGFSEAREVDRCFDFAIHDPVLKRVLTTPEKRAIIDRYEALTGRRLITWAGDYSHVAKKSEYKGLMLNDGVLYAETVHPVLTLEEVARELAIKIDAVQQLVRDGHLRLVRGSEDLVEKAELRDFKSYLSLEGLRLMQVRDRRHRPRTPKDYVAASRDMAHKEMEEVKAEIRERRPAKQQTGNPEVTPPEPDLEGATRRSKTSVNRPRGKPQ